MLRRRNCQASSPSGVRCTFIVGVETLAYVPDDIRKCVVFLGYKDANAIAHVAGSAFWIINVQQDPDLRNEYVPAYLVTAAHVLTDIRKHGQTVLMRTNKATGAEWDSSVNIGRWERHPDSSVDVAILKIAIQGDHAGWSTDSFVTEESAQEDHKDIEVGDEVFFPGLFWPHYGTARNIPIVRIGNIAALREEKLGPDYGEMDVYLVEARSIGGLSGSPVFMDVLAARITKEISLRPSIVGSSRFRLVGLISGHFKGTDKESQPGSISGDELEKLNMGIAFVTPSAKVLECLEVFMGEEKREIEEHRERKRTLSLDPTPQSNVAIKTTHTGTVPLKKD